MLDKTILLKILLLMSFLATVVVVWSFATYTSQNNNQNQTITSTVITISSSSKAKSSSSKSIQSSSISSLVSSSEIGSSSTSISSESSSVSSLPFPILENNKELVKDIELIIQKPDPKIQEMIKAAKNLQKVESENIPKEDPLSMPEDNSSTTDKPQ